MIDCAHVRLKPPYTKDYTSINRKNFHTNVQEICDATLSLLNLAMSVKSIRNNCFVFPAVKCITLITVRVCLYEEGVIQLLLFLPEPPPLLLPAHRCPSRNMAIEMITCNHIDCFTPVHLQFLCIVANRASFYFFFFQVRHGRVQPACLPCG